MSQDHYQIHQLAEKFYPSESGKKSVVIADGDHAKVVLFSVSDE